MRLFFAVTCSLVALGGAVEDISDLHGTSRERTRLLQASTKENHSKRDGANPLALDKIAMKRGIEELAIAKEAAKQAHNSEKDANAAQQNFLAVEATGRADEAWEKVRPMLPQARAQMLEVRKLEALAEMHAKHAQTVLFGSRYIPEAAAEKATEALKGWIKSDAENNAETPRPDNRLDRLAGAVAAAAEPYHLALLRNQKFCVETYAKAKSAQTSAAKLLDDAKKVALKAQELQAAGEGLEARQTWGVASGMTQEADKLRKWGDKLYGQANTACGTSGGYEMLEQQAATNVAMTSIMNAPAVLPAKGYD